MIILYKYIKTYRYLSIYIHTHTQTDIYIYIYSIYREPFLPLITDTRKSKHKDIDRRDTQTKNTVVRNLQLHFLSDPRQKFWNVGCLGPL